MSVLDMQIDQASEQFLVQQNRVIFEQMMERSPELVAERQLQLSKQNIIDDKLEMFYNETKNNNIYRYLITSSTLLKFVPSNCQFDDYGNPLVSIEELQ